MPCDKIGRRAGIGVFLLLRMAGAFGEEAEEMTTIPDNHPLRQKPQVTTVASEQLPQAELLGTPEVRTLLGYTRRPLYLPDGYTMALFSYSNCAPANWLFLVDARTLTSERYAIPNNDIASHSAALGKDGNIYIMPYATARAYRFVVASKQFESLATDVPEQEYTWDAFGASNGCIYFGTYPNAYFGEYDPATRRWSLWKQAVPNTKYVTTFSEEADGRIRFKAFGPDEVWMTFDPKSRQLEKAVPPQPPASAAPTPTPPEGDESYIARIEAQGRWFGVSHPTGRVWECKPGEAPVLCGDTGSPAESLWWMKATDDCVIGVSYFGAMFRYDLKTGAFQRGRLDNRAPGGNSIMFLEAVTPRCVIGANYSQQNLFRIDPTSGETIESDTVVARVTGEPMCAVGRAGKAYIGIYVRSILSIYDPDRPFEFLKNPRELVELGVKYAQTRPRDATTDGNLVFISSDSDYNHLGGALAVIEPKTEQVDVYHHLIRDQNLPTLAYDPVTKMVWGGTDRWGQMRSHPPTQESALIYTFDPKNRSVAATLVLWSGADVVSVHGVSANGVLVASCGAEMALIGTRTREVLYKGAPPFALTGKVRLGSDGRSYCMSGGLFYSWDFSENRLTPLARTGNAVHFTEPSRGLWVLADTKSVYRLRVSGDRS